MLDRFHILTSPICIHATIHMFMPLTVTVSFLGL
jgi:hypothetical protein